MKVELLLGGSWQEHGLEVQPAAASAAAAASASETDKQVPASDKLKEDATCTAQPPPACKCNKGGARAQRQVESQARAQAQGRPMLSHSDAKEDLERFHGQLAATSRRLEDHPRERGNAPSIDLEGIIGCKPQPLPVHVPLADEECPACATCSARQHETVCCKPQPLPTADPTGARQQLVASPGAYAEQTFRGNSRDSGGGETSPLPNRISETMEESDSFHIPVVLGNDLAVASLVLESCDDLPTAQPHTEDSSASSSKTKPCSCKTKLLLLGLFLMIAFLITLAIVLVLLVGGTDMVASDTTASHTDGPTQAPTSLTDSILSLLPKETATTILQDLDSPQAMAFDWLLQGYDDDDTMTHLSSERMVQKYALATLFFATEGDKWTDNSHWLDHSIHECDWFRVPSFARHDLVSALYPGYLRGFFPPSDPSPATCNDSGLYEHLWLDQNNLGGTLPEEVYLLSNLQTLSLGYNPMQGSISSHIGRLTRLEGLHLNSLPNFAPHALPSELGLLTHLRILELRSNNLQGEIPSKLWQLTALDTASLSRNPELYGSLPPFIGTTMKQLRWLSIEQCGLSGSIPSEIGLVTTLEMLSLYGNTLSGDVPTELTNLPKLQLLTLFANSLQGTIPTEFGRLTDLFLLSAFANQLTGSLPSELGRLTNLVVTLNWSRNQLSGSIPSELGLLSGLKELEFQGNQFSGHIPSEFGNLESVGHLTFASNDLSGTVPQQLSGLQQTLHTLTLEGNPLLTGTIPENVCNLNGTCINTSFDQCEGPFGVSFDCSPELGLCGCGGCSCV